MDLSSLTMASFTFLFQTLSHDDQCSETQILKYLQCCTFVHLPKMRLEIHSRMDSCIYIHYYTSYNYLCTVCGINLLNVDAFNSLTPSIQYARQAVSTSACDITVSCKIYFWYIYDFKILNMWCMVTNQNLQLTALKTESVWDMLHHKICVWHKGVKVAFKN